MKKTSKAQKKKQKRQLRLKGISAKVRPTERDIRIAQNLAAGMKKGKALTEAGVPEKSARSNSAEILARPGVRAALAEALDRADVNLDRVATSLNEGLGATKVISANLLIVDNGKEKPCKNGFIIDATEDKEGTEKIFIRVEDYPTRHKYLETSCKLLDLFPSERQPAGGELEPGEEASMIKQAEEAAGQRDVSRFTVIRER